MFYERFIQLCEQSNIKPTPLLKEFGLSSGNLRRWKEGSSVNSDILAKLSEYFGVSVDYLIGLTDAPNCANADIKIINGSHNVHCQNDKPDSASDVFNNREVLEAYQTLSTKDKLEIQLEIMKRKKDE